MYKSNVKAVQLNVIQPSVYSFLQSTPEPGKKPDCITCYSLYMVLVEFSFYRITIPGHKITSQINNIQYLAINFSTIIAAKLLITVSICFWASLSADISSAYGIIVFMSIIYKSCDAEQSAVPFYFCDMYCYTYDQISKRRHKVITTKE